MSELAKIFPLLLPEMTLEQEVQTVNDIRLGFFTNEMGQAEINSQLDEMLPKLSESECCTFLINLNAAYMKAKLWAEQHRKIKITLEVGERERTKQEQAEKKRIKKEKKLKTGEFKPAKEEKVVEILRSKNLTFDENSANDKAIKEFIKVTGSYQDAVKILINLGALPKDYKILDLK